MSDITKEVPLEKLNEWRDKLKLCLSPKVTFCNDMEKMNKEAEQIRGTTTYDVLNQIEVAIRQH